MQPSIGAPSMVDGDTDFSLFWMNHWFCCNLMVPFFLVFSLPWSVHLPLLTPCCSRPSIRRFSSYHRILQMIAFGIASRVRPLHLLVATSGGYVGYCQYHKYKLRELEHSGIEDLVQKSLASEWQVSQI
ncbi:hypothetical protein scyTo_0019912 [Scyliorhinus torazame]|uniref:OCIA domain-containing protein n=1 Tax=Scyliorhinus torazame TaxID=75743 RepID=A0A401PTZ7_SCYTO|nr:hypothetical protein [Scyliorhinus torazame]